MLKFDSLASLVANWVRPLVFAVEKAPPKVPRLKVIACAPEPKSGLSVATALPAAVTVMFGSVEVMVLSTPFAKVTVTGPKLAGVARSEEHTSELQSLMRISYAVFCLKKKKKRTSKK